jgi:hypothetical protein
MNVRYMSFDGRTVILLQPQRNDYRKLYGAQEIVDIIETEI